MIVGGPDMAPHTPHRSDAPRRSRGAPRAAEAVEREVDDGRRVERQQLAHDEAADDGDAERLPQLGAHAAAERERHAAEQRGQDRKSTRLNSSHTVISYAVFCLKK